MCVCTVFESQEVPNDLSRCIEVINVQYLPRPPRAYTFLGTTTYKFSLLMKRMS
ncbi:hypothetical protein BDZ97DRAFT_1796332 [Flammula alnicola]|nr:hypothetical protein BDZ97DRAFT_1796332 [Flammula alnicola]